MNKTFILIISFLIHVSVSAQKKKIKFHSINQFAMVGGESQMNSAYQTINGINFSADRDIAVTGSAPMKLALNFKEYNFNQPQTFPFTISKNYSVKYD